MPDIDLGPLIRVLGWVCGISIPLGIWKCVDLVIFALHHIRIS